MFAALIQQAAWQPCMHVALLQPALLQRSTPQRTAAQRVAARRAAPGWVDITGHAFSATH
jgi:hypothetical protein